MKLRIKILIILGLTTLIFIALNTIDAIRLSFITEMCLTIIFSITLYTLLHKFILQPLEKTLRLQNTNSQKPEAGILIKETIDKPSYEEKSLVKNIQPVKKEKVQSTEYLAQLTRYDSITNLPNQILFNEILNKAISHAKRREKILAILLIDIKLQHNEDKTIDDEILRDIGVRFSSTLRSEDVLAKLDDNQFVVLLNDIGKAKFASAVAEKLLDAAKESLIHNETEYRFDISIGICIYPTEGQTLETLMKNVESALYKAKQSSKDTYQFYTEEMDQEAHQYRKLEGALRKAINENQLALYFQPKLHIKQGAIVGVEALLRWNHPEFGIIQPAQFIPLAEEIGLIMQIGEWTFREACKINKYWQDEGYEHITVSVNISPKQFHHPELAAILEKVLKETELHPNYLELEINESAIMSDIEKANEQLEKIKAIGIKISIDHFGTGYTSISHLKKFPISSVKIDRNFIQGVPNSPNDSIITNAFITLAHNLGLETVAEGVETAEQVQYLAAQNCDVIQGYFLSLPLPAKKVELQFKKLRVIF